MAHNLSIRKNGMAEMFSAGTESVWHGLGQRSASAVTWEEAQRLAGLDWTVEKRKLYDQFGQELPAHGTFRTDLEGAAGFLGCVGSDYEIIQNSKMGEVLDTVIGVENGAHYETAGAIDGGRKTWALLRLPTDIKVGNDISQNYLFMSNSHDGSMKAVVKLTSTRIVCQNTLGIALKDSGSFFKITHTKSAAQRIEDAMAAVRSVNDQIGSLNIVMNELAGKQMSMNEFRLFVDKIFPKKLDKNGQETSQNITKKQMVAALFEHNDGDAFPEQRGTYFNALNAVTAYTDHFAAAQGDVDKNRAISALYGANFALKFVAMQELAIMAGVNRAALSRIV
jgi:phage/plasmid-like protein (TIGR03299 family)